MMAKRPASPAALRAIFTPANEDDASNLSAAKQIQAVRTIAARRLMTTGVSDPALYEILEHLGIEREECSESWNAFCAVLAFTYWLGFTTGQLVPTLQASEVR
jgi:hypothetical protein